MTRNPVIEDIARNLCAKCRKGIESYKLRNPGAGKKFMAFYALSFSCRKCKQVMLQGAARVHGR